MEQQRKADRDAKDYSECNTKAMGILHKFNPGTKFQLSRTSKTSTNNVLVIKILININIEFLTSTNGAHAIIIFTPIFEIAQFS